MLKPLRGYASGVRPSWLFPLSLTTTYSPWAVLSFFFFLAKDATSYAISWGWPFLEVCHSIFNIFFKFFKSFISPMWITFLKVRAFDSLTDLWFLTSEPESLAHLFYFWKLNSNSPPSASRFSRSWRSLFTKIPILASRPKDMVRELGRGITNVL